MIAILLLMTIPALMWIVQSIALKVQGLPLRIRIDQRGLPEELRVINRVITQLGVAAIVLVYPILISQQPIAYYRERLSSGPAMWQFIQGFSVATTLLSMLFLVWLGTERIEIDLHHSRAKTIRRLGMLIPTALFGAFFEELLFRGVVQSDLLRYSTVSANSSILISSLVFSLAHYVRPVKRYWTFPGHVLLGVLLGFAYVRTGNLWLATGLHAGGIFMIMGTRPFFRYKGPAWLTGASIFPFAGVVGIMGLCCLMNFVKNHYGVQP